MGLVPGPEIFGRFVLLHHLDATGPESFRAVDLESDDGGALIALRRVPVALLLHKKEREAHRAAGALHARIRHDGVTRHVDTGELDGRMFSARHYVPGVSLDELLACARRREQPLSAVLRWTVAFIVGSTLVDLEDSPTHQSENFLVSLQVRPRRIILQRSGSPVLLGPTFRRVDPGAEEARYRVDLERPSAAELLGVLFELCTGADFNGDVDLETEGPLGRLPRELVGVGRDALQGSVSPQALLRPLARLLSSCGGGDLSHVLSEVTALHGSPDDLDVEADKKLARRLRRRRKAASTHLLDERMPTQKLAHRLTARLTSRAGPALVALATEPPHGMLIIPGGRLPFACEDGAPRHVEVRPFLIDKSPVTCGEYARFCKATGHVPPPSWMGNEPPSDAIDRPVVEVGPDDAFAYARWADKRLPTEVEWELAARGFDGRLWPWGHDFDERVAGAAWKRPWSARRPARVTDHPAAISPFGVACLLQCWEWTSTPALELSSSSLVVRGGAWRDRSAPPQITNRSHEDGPAPDLTFRCARDL